MNLLRLSSCKVLILLLTFFVLPGTLEAKVQPWKPVGPDGGDARRIGIDPSNRSHLYLGAANGWLFESSDGGASWQRLAEIAGRDDLVLDSIVIDPRRPEHMAVGAWVLDRPDGGIFLTEDRGKTWTSQPQMRGQSVRSLAISVSDPKVIVAGTLQGVFRTQDGGEHWARISPPDSAEIHEVQSVAIDPVDPKVIYAGTWHLPWKTTDGGEHWNNIKKGIIDDSDVFSIIVDPVSPAVVYASACSGIYKSDDAGLLFEKVQGIPSTARRTRVLLQDPQNRDVVFAGTTEGLYRTSNAGRVWSRLTGPEIIVNDVSVDPKNSQRVMLATDRGGVLASDDGGETFHSSNLGFSARQVTSAIVDRQEHSTLYIGVANDREWGGVFISPDGGINWKQESQGLQGLDVFSLGQAPDATVVAGTSHGLYRLDATNEGWHRVAMMPADLSANATASAPVGLPRAVRSPVPVLRNQFVKRSARANGRSSRLAAPQSRSKNGQHAGTQLKSSGRSVVSRADRRSVGSSTAADVSTTASKATVRVPAGAGALRPVDPPVYAITTAGQTLLAATSSGLFQSSDNGLSWTTNGPEERTEWALLASANENVVAAATHRVIYSSDAGKTWVPVGLPEQLTQVSSIVVLPAGEIWVGSREGLFRSTDAGTTWSQPAGIYASPVKSLNYDPSTSRVTVVTAGHQGTVFTVRLPDRAVAYFESGWNLRFAQQIGDRLFAATLFDGVVVQPGLVAPATGSAGDK